MAEPRRYIGVRISEQGHRYIQLVAGRDRINYSEALRRLLALGAKTDMEAHSDSGTGTRVGESGGVRDLGSDGDGDRDFDGDAGSGSVPHVPHTALGDAIRTQAGIGDAIGTLVHAGLNPSAVQDGDGPSAA